MITTKLAHFSLATLILTAGALAVTQQEPADGQQVQTRTQNRLVCEPLVIFDSSGSTLLGPTHKHLSVYSNGRVTLSQASGAPNSGRNVSTVINPTTANNFLLTLNRHGVFRLLDQEATVTDVPLNTVTVFNGSTDAAAHTFSYWLGNGTYQPIQTTIDAFITQTFEQ